MLVASARGRTLTRPRMQIVGPVLDSADPIALAGFYERLLGWPVVAREGPRPGSPPEDGWAKLRSPSEDMKIEIQWEPHYVPPTWPPADSRRSSRSSPSSGPRRAS